MVACENWYNFGNFIKVLFLAVSSRFKRILSRFCECSCFQKFNLCSGPKQSQFLRFYAAKCKKVDFILKIIFVYYTSVIRNRFVWIIFYPDVGF